ncbi:uncharacterized protein N7482_009732 [Penicillium canariense]|uniref:NmrA-like domain-containing protein n=1 Tax=Penicillium canariense TaxID=189055 RepID=A0A9W9HTS5_9EURO|nr:uncharacterized protein N7482_009732 [Penicillium canariense]KAJ5153254.1 hypothetical protein N7482_009732 [Penicillium canariense]
MECFCPYGTNIEAVIQLLPLFGQKKELIGYLKSKETEGLTWTGIATSGLFDWEGLLNRTATIWDGGHKSFTLINERPLGQAVVSALQNPEQTRNQYLYVASVETSQQEILAALEKVTGGKWTVNKTTTEAQLTAAAKKLTVGDFNGTFILVRATIFGNMPGVNANYAKETVLANDLLGLKLETVEETVNQAANN